MLVEYGNKKAVVLHDWCGAGEESHLSQKCIENEAVSFLKDFSSTGRWGRLIVSAIRRRELIITISCIECLLCTGHYAINFINVYLILILKRARNDCKETRETFWSVEIILALGLGGGYMGVYLWQNSSNCPLNICAFCCMWITSQILI